MINADIDFVFPRYLDFHARRRLRSARPIGLGRFKLRGVWFVLWHFTAFRTANDPRRLFRHPLALWTTARRTTSWLPHLPRVCASRERRMSLNRVERTPASSRLRILRPGESDADRPSKITRSSSVSSSLTMA